MLDIHSIASRVKHNCNISDAKYWGFYSPCGLLLRLRDLYRSETGLQPWQRVDNEGILGWIEQREALWGKLAGLDFADIGINGREYRPFDVKGINAALLKEGLFYGAGYGDHLKPSFLLAPVLKKHANGRYRIYFTGREFAHDLSTAPAMLQGNTIVARHEVMEALIIEKFEEMKARIRHSALSFAFSEYGILKDDKRGLTELADHLAEIASEELSTYIHHELGEASQRKLLGRWWKNLIVRLPHSRSRLFLRGLKDILSDVCGNGMLTHIIKNRKAGSLGFYVAMLGGFRKIIFKDIATAYEEFLGTRDWGLIEKARTGGYAKARGYIKTLRKMADTGRASVPEIERRLISKIT